MKTQQSKFSEIVQEDQKSGSVCLRYHNS